MIVAWDARKLRDGGIGSYIRHTLGALSAAPGEASYVALVDPEDHGRVRWPGPVVEVAVRAGKYGLGEHWAVPRAARAAGAALLHAPHYTLPLGWSGPAVVTIHDLIHVRFARFFPPGAALYALAMAGAAARRARHVITDSEHGRQDVLELLRVPPDRVTAIPLAASPALGPREPAVVRAFREERGLPADYLLYVGARKRHKNLGLLVEALARMEASERPSLVLAGSRWPPGDPLAALARRSGVDEAVRFSGDVGDDEQLALLYGGAALYVQPSLGEGFGLPPLEAMACGIPVLSSNAGSLPEVVGEAGLLLPPAEPERWARAIRDLLADSERRARMRRAGLERAATFRWETTAARTREIYRRVMERR